MVEFNELINRDNIPLEEQKKNLMNLLEKGLQNFGI